MDRPSSPDATEIGTEPTDATTPSTDPQSSASNNPKKPLPKRLAVLPDARERFSVNGEKMMFNYKRTRKPNKNKTNKKAITMQAMSRSGSTSGARMSTDHTQQEGVGGTSFDEADAVTLYPAPSATPGAHNNPWDGGDYFPAFDSSYSQAPSSFQATQVPMNPNPYFINTRQHLPMQTQASGYELMQPTQQPEPDNQHPVSTSGDNALHLRGHAQHFRQGPPVEFIQYPSSSVQGTSDVSTQYPHTWSNYQQQPEWSMEEDNDHETSALPRESTQDHNRDAQIRRR